MDKNAYVAFNSGFASLLHACFISVDKLGLTRVSTKSIGRSRGHTGNWFNYDGLSGDFLVARIGGRLVVIEYLALGRGSRDYLDRGFGLEEPGSGLH